MSTSRSVIDEEILAIEFLELEAKQGFDGGAWTASLEKKRPFGNTWSTGSKKWHHSATGALREAEFTGPGMPLIIWAAFRGT